MERIKEGPEPKKDDWLPINTVFEQLATWFGTTTDEIGAKFKLDDLVHNWGDAAGPPTLIQVRFIDRSDIGFGALCDISDNRDHIIGAKIAGYLYETGEIKIQNTGIRQ